MGSQQLLLVVLGMVVVGVALAVAITMFQANAVELNRSSLADDLLYFAGRARDYYWRPLSLGGGNKSFAGITNLRMLSQMTMNENGRYYIDLSRSDKDKLFIIGRGKIAVGQETTQVEIRINEQTNTLKIVY